MTTAPPPHIPLRTFRIILPLILGSLPIGILLAAILHSVPAVKSAAAPRFVCGCAGNPTRVTYILDLSKGADDDRLRQSLIDSIWQLDVTAGQTFDVLVSGSPAVSPFGHGVVLCTPHNKKLAVDFVRVCSAHASIAATVQAIRVAFADRPDLIYYITDGPKDPAFRTDVACEFSRLNADRRVHVNMIACPGMGSRVSFDTMREIAAANGGTVVALQPSDATHAPSAVKPRSTK